jgi:DNA-binding MarR family transcriptional regulator
LDIARREAFAAHDLETGEFDVLASLRRSGTPYNLSPSQLVNLLLVTSGTMTNRIDRLEAKGMVERLPDPNDGRGVIVRLTNAGKVAVDQAVTDLLDRERVLLDSVSADNQKVIADLLRQIVLPLDDANMPSDE